jgi:hypothetical protein
MNRDEVVDGSVGRDDDRPGGNHMTAIRFDPRGRAAFDL